MGSMTLIEAVERLDSLDADCTLYVAQPWGAKSPTIAAPEPDGGGLPEEAERLMLDYFLEVFIARDFLEDWSSDLDQSPTLQDKCNRLISYAKNDA